MSRHAVRVAWSYIRYPKKTLRLLWRLPGLLGRRAYHNWDGKTITYGHLGLLVFWLAVNVVVDLDWRWLSPLGSPTRRSALASVLNIGMAILCGRTFYVAELFGMSLQLYYLLHHWMSRIALLQSLFHAGIHIKQQKGWTTTAGIGLGTTVLFIIINLLSVSYVRRTYTVAFIWCHRILVCAFLCFLTTHIWLAHPNGRNDAIIYLLCIIGISTLLILYRWRQLQKAQVSIDRCRLTIVGPCELREIHTGATRVKFPLTRDTAVYPGAYFYIRNEHDSFWRRLLGVPMAVYEWTPSGQSWSDGKSLASELTFLIEDHPSLAPLLPRTKLTIDGPYGQDLRLHRYDNVYILAEGIGIASAIPFASSFARRRLFDSERKQSVLRGSNEQLCLDRIRRLTLIWAMEENSQLEWARNEIYKLMKLDPGLKLLHVWLYQPERPDHTHTFPSLIEVQEQLQIRKAFSKHYKVSHVPKNRWSETMRHQLTGSMKVSSGTIAVAVCGTPDFRDMARGIANEHTRANFYELEYQPVPRLRSTATLPEEISQQLSARFISSPAQPSVVRQACGTHTSIAVEQEYELRSLYHK